VEAPTKMTIDLTTMKTAVETNLNQEHFKNEMRVTDVATDSSNYGAERTFIVQLEPRSYVRPAAPSPEESKD
jgi:hypothetical protein